jgi:hypothetical protein
VSADDVPHCPGVNEAGGCGVVTMRIRGHVCLCLSCSEAEIGETVGELRERVTAKMLRGKTRRWSVHSTGARERGVLADQSKAKEGSP